MKTQDIAVNAVYNLIIDQDWGISAYKYTVPLFNTAVFPMPNEFFVVNALPISAGVMQSCRVNVNFHVKDLANGIPDTTRMEEVTGWLTDLMEEVDGTLMMIDFESQEYHREQQLNMHYSNVRLNVKLIN
jgi:hypothetical protein